MGILPNAFFNCSCLSLLQRLPSEFFQMAYVDSGSLGQGSEVEPNEIPDYVVQYTLAFQQIRRVIASSGVVVWHILPLIAGQGRMILDQIFGIKNFRTEIILRKRSVPLRRKMPTPEHETLLVYSKSDAFTFNPPTRALNVREIQERFPKGDVNGPYRLTDLTMPIVRPDFQYELNGFTPPEGRSWRYSKQKIKAMEEAGKIDFSGRTPRQKLYISETTEIEITESVWDDLPIYAMGKEKILEGQRSISLISRIIETFSNQGDCILDPCCGAGTSFVVAARSQRHWIGCESNYDTFLTMQKRIAQDLKFHPTTDYRTGSEEDLSGEPVIEPLCHPTESMMRKLNGPQTFFILDQPLSIEETRHYEFKEIKGNNPVNSIKDVAEQYAVAFLNSEGGQLFWGVRDNDRKVVGVKLQYSDRDELRRVITEKLDKISPSVPPTSYRIEFHPVSDGIKVITELYVVQMTIPKPSAKDLFFTAGGDAWVKTDGGKKKLTGGQINEEIRKRNSE